jgi:hypothetical protein
VTPGAAVAIRARTEFCNSARWSACLLDEIDVQHLLGRVPMRASVGVGVLRGHPRGLRGRLVNGTLIRRSLKDPWRARVLPDKVQGCRCQRSP